LRVATLVSDRPGGLAALLACVAHAGGNLLSVEHVRDAVDLHVRQTGVELTLETRGAEHAEAILEALREQGYGVRRLGGA
jgi:threonine dehydratase